MQNDIVPAVFEMLHYIQTDILFGIYIVQAVAPLAYRDSEFKLLRILQKNSIKTSKGLILKLNC